MDLLLAQGEGAMVANLGNRACPDCGAAVEEIRLLDRTYGGEVDIQYTRPDSKRGFFRPFYPVAGTLRGYRCVNWSRVLLYGEAMEA